MDNFIAMQKFAIDSAGFLNTPRMVGDLYAFISELADVHKHTKFDYVKTPHRIFTYHVASEMIVAAMLAHIKDDRIRRSAAPALGALFSILDLRDVGAFNNGIRTDDTEPSVRVFGSEIISYSGARIEMPRDNGYQTIHENWEMRRFAIRLMKGLTEEYDQSPGQIYRTMIIRQLLRIARETELHDVDNCLAHFATEIYVEGREGHPEKSPQKTALLDICRHLIVKKQCERAADCLLDVIILGGHDLIPNTRQRALRMFDDAGDERRAQTVIRIIKKSERKQAIRRFRPKDRIAARA